MGDAGLICPPFLDEVESASICPLLTPSPSDANMLCVSPDQIQDPESASMCPLLESSPPNDVFRHPLDPLAVLGFEPELPNYVGLNEARDSRSSSLPGSNGDSFAMKRGSGPNNMNGSSSSSSSSALQENPASVQLLNHHYQQLGAEKKEAFTQENGAAACVDLPGHKMTSEHCFVNWNWPVIRMSCFVTVLSITVGSLCMVIGMVATVPKTCYPSHQWHQGGVFYEVFPASFQDSGHDGLGDIRGVASRTEYFKSLGVSAIRLNSILPATVYPEAFDEIKNLTAIDHHLGTIEDLKYLLTALHSNNISVILDLPIYPVVKSLGELKILSGKDVPIRKDNIADKITNVVHNHRSHREVNHTDVVPERLLSDAKPEFAEKKSMLNPYIDGGISGVMKGTSEHLKTITRTVVEEALYFWFDIGVDGIYIKGLENYIYDPQFLSELQNWDKIKKSYSNDRQKILMTDYIVLEEAERDQKEDILTAFDLLDVYLEVSNGTQFMADEINRIINGETFKSKKYPWIHWNIGNMNTRRLIGRVGSNIGAILFESLLPGTISIFYGDEVGMTDSHDPHGDRSDMKQWHQLSPMQWINDNNKFTPDSIMPWLPYGNADHDPVTRIIRNITDIRRSTPSVYMNKVWKDGEVLLNCAVRFVDDEIIIVERSYPRRNSFVVFYNPDVKDIRRDITNIYYGGELIQDSEGKAGYFVTFKDFNMNAGEALVVKLDK